MISILARLCLSSRMEVSDEQWARIRRFVPVEERGSRSPRRGRPWTDARAVLNGILWVLRTGAPWSEIPRRYAPPSTCHRRFQKWQREGVLERMVHGLASKLLQLGRLDLHETFIDGSHAGAKRGALWSGGHGEARPRRSWR